MVPRLHLLLSAFAGVPALNWRRLTKSLNLQNTGLLTLHNLGPTSASLLVLIPRSELETRECKNLAQANYLSALLGLLRFQSAQASLQSTELDLGS